jgi:hypothetical protein
MTMATKSRHETAMNSFRKELEKEKEKLEEKLGRVNARLNLLDEIDEKAKVDKGNGGDEDFPLAGGSE